MSDSNIKKGSLDAIRRMKEVGELFHDPLAPSGESLGKDFWDQAAVTPAKMPTSVHLKLDPEVFDFFKRGGKGHLTRMQNVLKAYVDAHRRKVG
jgi:uncharacterized protein (DUF4415 family)